MPHFYGTVSGVEGAFATSLTVSGEPVLLAQQDIPVHISDALIGDDGITVTSGSNETTIEGFYDEFVAASGALNEHLRDEAMSGFIYETATGTITLIESAGYPLEILSLVGSTKSGTVSGTLDIDGTPVGGINTVTWDTTQDTATATSDNTVLSTNTVTLTITENSTFQRFGFTLKTRRV